MDTVTLRHEVVVRIVFWTDGHLTVEQASWYVSQCPRFEVEELAQTLPHYPSLTVTTYSLPDM
jgi:hypothetical protein